MANVQSGKMIVGLDIGTSKVVALVGEVGEDGVIEIVGIGIVIVIVDVHGGVIVTARGDNLDAAVAQRGIHRGELLVRNIDILQGDLNLVLGYRSPV